MIKINNTDTDVNNNSVEEYISKVPEVALTNFNELRNLIISMLPSAKEVLSYGVVGYKTDSGRAKIFIAGWKDHIGLYPLPKGKAIQTQIKPYVKGKGTMWFSIDKPLPIALLKKIIVELTK